MPQLSCSLYPHGSYPRPQNQPSTDCDMVQHTDHSWMLVAISSSCNFHAETVVQMLGKLSLCVTRLGHAACTFVGVVVHKKFSTEVDGIAEPLPCLSCHLIRDCVSSRIRFRGSIAEKTMDSPNDVCLWQMDCLGLVHHQLLPNWQLLVTSHQA